MGQYEEVIEYDDRPVGEVGEYLPNMVFGGLTSVDRFLLE